MRLTAIGQIVALISVLGGLLFTARSYRLTVASGRVDRLAKALDQVGHTSRTVQQGGLFTLWLIAEEQGRHWPMTEQLLCSYVREHAGSADLEVQVALELLGRRPSLPPGKRGRRLLLSGLGLRDRSLSGGNFSRVIFDDTDLSSARLTDADLTRCSFRAAHLEGADLSGAHLEGADLRGASLRGSILRNVHWRGANVEACDFGGSTYLDREALKQANGQPLNTP